MAVLTQAVQQPPVRPVGAPLPGTDRAYDLAANQGLTNFYDAQQQQAPPRQLPGGQARFAAPGYGLAGSEQILGAGLGDVQNVLGTSLTGSQEALRKGTQAARQDITEYGGLSREAMGAGGQAAQARIDQGVAGYQPYMEGGQQAQQLQAALSGALGPEAQKEAYTNFQSSPGQQFLTNQAEQALLRNASATGGLGGGAVLDALQKQAIGYASQDFGNQFNRLGGLSERGLQAAGGAGGLYGQGAGLAQNMGLAIGGQYADQGAQLGQLEQSLGIGSADLITGAGKDYSQAIQGTTAAASQGRLQAGQNISGAIGSTTAGVADYQAGYGKGTADLIGEQTVQLANAFQQGGGDLANDMMGFVDYLMKQGYSEAEAQAQAQLARGSKGGTSGSAANVAKVATAFSDARLKTNILKLSANSIGPSLYQWDWTEEALPLVGDQPSYGVIAQEIQKIQPDAVIRGADGWLRVIYPRINSWLF